MVWCGGVIHSGERIMQTHEQKYQYKPHTQSLIHYVKSHELVCKIYAKYEYFIFCLFYCGNETIIMTLPQSTYRGRSEASRNDRLRQTSSFVVKKTRSRMEEEARKLLEEGIRKKLVSPGKGELSTFPNGTKVRLPCPLLDELSPVF